MTHTCRLASHFRPDWSTLPLRPSIGSLHEIFQQPRSAGRFGHCPGFPRKQPQISANDKTTANRAKKVRNNLQMTTRIRKNNTKRIKTTERTIHDWVVGRSRYLRSGVDFVCYRSIFANQHGVLWVTSVVFLPSQAPQVWFDN